MQKVKGSHAWACNHPLIKYGAAYKRFMKLQAKVKPYTLRRLWTLSGCEHMTFLRGHGQQKHHDKHLLRNIGNAVDLTIIRAKHFSRSSNAEVDAVATQIITSAGNSSGLLVAEGLSNVSGCDGFGTPHRASTALSQMVANTLGVSPYFQKNHRMTVKVLRADLEVAAEGPESDDEEFELDPAMRSEVDIGESDFEDDVVIPGKGKKRKWS